MNHSIRYASCLLLMVFLILAGCGEDESMLEDTTDDIPMSTHLEEFSSALDTIAQLTHTHEDAITAAPNIEALDEAVDAYTDDLHAQLDAMHHQAEDIESCALDGAAPPTRELHNALDALEDELGHYQESMHGVADLEAAHQEHERHYEAMEQILATLGAAHETLHAMGEQYRCYPHEEEHVDDEGHHHDDEDHHDDGDHHEEG